MDVKTARIRALNDELRHKLTEGTVVMTQGVAALGCDAVARIVQTISVFDDFCNAHRIDAAAINIRKRKKFPSKRSKSNETG